MTFDVSPYQKPIRQITLSEYQTLKDNLKAEMERAMNEAAPEPDYEKEAGLSAKSGEISKKIKIILTLKACAANIQAEKGIFDRIAEKANEEIEKFNKIKAELDQIKSVNTALEKKRNAARIEWYLENFEILFTEWFSVYGETIKENFENSDYHAWRIKNDFDSELFDESEFHPENVSRYHLAPSRIIQ